MSEECFISSSQDSQISSIERRLSKFIIFLKNLCAFKLYLDMLIQMLSIIN